MKAGLVLLILLCIFAQNSEAQEDSTHSSSAPFHDPRKAAIMSAVLPGLGQAYNQKYWKIPIVYAGLGTSAYFIRFNSGEYISYRDAYVARMDEDSTTTDNFPLYSSSNIKSLRDYYHRNLEVSCIAAGLVYVMNILDATVDAHLFEFDVSDDLSLNVQACPLTVQQQSYAGLRLTFSIKP